ncbi:MAG: hypothetical protein K2X11_17850 [Acetobacteraceae bacterium]|nr:hypothetical protein [Acetobacteraceae bacterium]
MQTIVKLFDSHEHAEAAIRDLETAGFGHDRLSLVRRQADAATTTTTDGATDDDASAAGVGATIGTLVGGGAGLLAGLGMLAIPGLGPVVAAGWLVAALTTAGVGAATGGIIGALTGGGVEEADAHVYAEGVRRGGSLVTVRCEDAGEAARAESILARHMPVTLRDRESQYRQEGWSRYEENDTMASPPVEQGGLGTGAGTTTTGPGLGHTRTGV